MSLSAVNDVGLEKPGRPRLAGMGEPYTKQFAIGSTCLMLAGRDEPVGTTLPAISAVNDAGFEKPGRPWLAGTGEP